jgi:hypothetical protein
LCIRRLALGQLLLSLTIALVLVGVALCRFGHPAGYCLWGFALGFIVSDCFELFETLLEPLLVDQAPPGGIGGDSRAIQGATRRCRQQRQGRAYFSPRPKAFEKFFYPLRPYRRQEA